MTRLRTRIARGGRLVEMMLAAGIASLLGAGLVGAHGGDTSKLHGCYPTGGGTLELVAATAVCPTGYDAVDWSIVGAAGDAGPKGPAGSVPGAPGPGGPAGDRGASGAGYTVRVVTGKLGENFAKCATDERVVGGGYSMQDNGYLEPSVVWNKQDSARNSWTVDGAGMYQRRVSAVCARKRVDLLDLPIVPRP
jgi:hypothetical protein